MLFQLYPLVLFNSLAWPRRELISIRVSTLHVWVFDAEGRVIPSQLDPVWPDVAGTETTPNLFSLHFLAQLPALGASTVFIKVRTAVVIPRCTSLVLMIALCDV